MSLESGVTASQDLLDLFSKSKDGSVRMIRVLIRGETLVSGSSSPSRGSWRDDFEGLLQPAMRQGACYVLYQLDSRNELGARVGALHPDPREHQVAR
ncbi:twinfilin-1-like [Hemitrygon akajei]|uniref:twinfilin-1-like n=1 Tax=Hemitrygon akajei TaxID=2704970 RepID=UPI003BF9AE4A